MKLADLDLNKVYTYFDYLKWTFEERVELIKGKIFEMSAPSRIHQKIQFTIGGLLFNYLKDKDCEAYTAPFDVRIPRKLADDRDIITVLQPDACVICDRSKLDDKGCLGAPDIVVEILSPGNNKRDLKYKYEIYEEAGVKEYWVLDPVEKSMLCYTLADGQFVGSKFLYSGDVFQSHVLSGFSLDLDELFKGLE